MAKDVEIYVKNCITFNRTKPINSKPQDLLSPLQIPDAPWTSLSVDFITDLPPSAGYDCIMVVVDRFTKWSEFFPCHKTITAQDTAKIFLKDIFLRHGLPTKIIFYCGPQFVSLFTTALWINLQIKPCVSSAFHPQSDGQAERVNQCLEQYLRCYISCHQDDWSS